MRKVKLDAIRIDGGTQCRLVIDQPTVYTYLEAMKEGDEFPLMETVFDGSTYWLTDGFHRYHAFKLLGIKEIEIKYKPGTLQDAQIEALKANSKHGKPLTNEDKRNKVEMALKIEGFAEKSNYEIAKLCEVSQPLVASVRNPAKKEKQAANKAKHILKKAEELSVTNQISSENTTAGENTEKIPADGQNPDDAEMQATELAMQADLDTMYKLLEADEPLKEAHDEIKRLNHLNSQLEIQLRGITNERNEAIRMIKRLQKENDKLKAKK
jgi:ParB-like chromosome segregation protein Spo0J